MRLIFLGPPGAGKGTQASILAAQWQIPHICTGQMLRECIARKTSLGLQAQAYVENGELVPDKLVVSIIEQRLRQPDTRKGWILDGFPRTLSQADALDYLMQSMGQSYNQAFSFYVTFNVLVDRMLKRGRTDDTTEIIHKRLHLYQEHTASLIQRYQKRGCLTIINGDRPVEAVTQFLQASVVENNASAARLK